MPEPPENTVTYDVFISYSHVDSEWVYSWLTPRLKEAGLTVCTDRESFAVGAPSLVNMEKNRPAACGSLGEARGRTPGG